jgi:hypothetical protein
MLLQCSDALEMLHVTFERTYSLSIGQIAKAGAMSQLLWLCGIGGGHRWGMELFM